MVPASEALQRLKDGNVRFVAGKSAEMHRTHKLVDNQKPFAIVLGCSDSRVPPEIVFDHGVGDMFCIRVAGNIVTPLELGSVEFAAIEFGPRLVVVMGHSCCGAVQATVKALADPDADLSGLSAGMQTIVSHIGESVNREDQTGTESDHQSVVDRTIDDNVRNSVRSICNGSSVLKDLIANDGMVVVGARYAIETGVVEFIECPEVVGSHA